MSSSGQQPTGDRLPAFDLGSLDAEGRAVADRIMGERSRLPSPFRVWLESPALADSMHSLGQFLARDLTLSKAEAELVILSAAAHIRADYVFAVHSTEARSAGLDQRAIEAIKAGKQARSDDRRLNALSRMVHAVLHDEQPPTDEVFQNAVAALAPVGVAEALVLLGYFTAVGSAMKLYAVQPPSGAIP